MKPLPLTSTIGALTAEFIGTTKEAGLKAGVFACFLYIFWWCFFIDATQYVYVSEIFPNHLRSAGVAVGLSSFYAASEVTLVAAPIALTAIGWKFYLVIICPSAVYILIIYFLFPETKNRTLEEIGAIFGETQIANNVYGATEEERNKIHEAALGMTEGGKLTLKAPGITHIEGKEA